MISCPKCESLMPTHYTKCQKCGAELPKLTRENAIKFTSADNKKEKEIEAPQRNQALAVDGEIDISEMN